MVCNTSGIWWLYDLLHVLLVIHTCPKHHSNQATTAFLFSLQSSAKVLVTLVKSSINSPNSLHSVQGSILNTVLPFQMHCKFQKSPLRSSQMDIKRNNFQMQPCKHQECGKCITGTVYTSVLERKAG